MDRPTLREKKKAYRSPVVSGNGWFAIGNPAGFTNPLISPGINAGIETAYIAAKYTCDILAAPEDKAVTLMKQRSEEYHSYSHDFMGPSLHNMNRFWYTFFRDHELFDALLKAFWACGVGSICTKYKKDFDDHDIGWLVGAGHEAVQQLCAKVFAIVDPFSIGPVPQTKIDEVKRLGEAAVHARSTLYPENAWGRYLRKYNNQLQLVEGKRERDPGGNFYAIRCRHCKSWVHDNLERCPICATKTRGGLNVTTESSLTPWVQKLDLIRVLSRPLWVSSIYALITLVLSILLFIFSSDRGTLPYVV